MKDYPQPKTVRPAAVVFVLLAVACATFASDEYVHEDARISGKEIHGFVDAGENVSVVLGDFRLVVGKRVLTGRDAVVWVKQKKFRNTIRHDIVVYVEGDAKMVEPSGTSVEDRWMIVVIHQDGRLTAAGLVSNRPLKNFPLYRRAVDRRKGAASRAKDTSRTRPAPPLVRTTSRPSPTVKVTRPPVSESTTGVKSTVPTVVNPVSFRADKVSSRWIGQGVHRRRVTILKGNVYLSQGDPSSGKGHMSLRCQAAVIFTKKIKAPPDPARTPYRPQPGGFGPAGAGDQQKERIVGAYLEGDVIVTRGERTMRGSRAYYDFTTDRATVLDVVFRTVQTQRNIPIYVRADEARALSVREIYFKNPRISTSDFYTMTYHIGGKSAYLMDRAEYDAKGVRITPQSWYAKVKGSTFNIRGVPLTYWPVTEGDFEQGHTALRKVQAGRSRNLGWGVDTEWHLFRLMGLLRPEGFKGRLELNWHERGPEVGVNIAYSRQNYSGYALAYGMIDEDRNDDFGDLREGIESQRTRGRVLLRHKHRLPSDWRLQFELSYMSDRNYLEQFFPNEFYAGKEQETLIYAKKQRDNWAFTGLLKARLNRFQTQTESAPDAAFYLVGQPLLGDDLTYFGEMHAGFVRHRPDDDAKGVLGSDSKIMARLDTRNEFNYPMHLGPVNLTPYAVGRLTYWDDVQPGFGETFRAYGQVGVKANMRFWRAFNGVRSRMWDINRLRHIITPEIVAFLADSPGVAPRELYPMDPGIEQHLGRQSGVTLGIYQRLQTKRGPAGKQRTVDWMRFNLIAGFYNKSLTTQTSNGRGFFYRPEYSIGRNHVNAEYVWHISDSTTFSADTNYDTDSRSLKRANVGLSVVRDPRLRYYLGMRYLQDLNSAIGTFGVTYKINRKYTVSFFEQYDFNFNDGENLSSSFTITRKLPRWYAAVTFTFDQRDNDVTMLLTFWPEGIPEVRIGTGRVSLLSQSEMN